MLWTWTTSYGYELSKNTSARGAVVRIGIGIDFFIAGRGLAIVADATSGQREAGGHMRLARQPGYSGKRFGIQLGVVDVTGCNKALQHGGEQGASSARLAWATPGLPSGQVRQRVAQCRAELISGC